MASHSINIHSYRRVIDVNDFIDYLISERIINRQAYEFVLSKNPEDRLNYLIDEVESQKNRDVRSKVLDYLSDQYPNIEEILQVRHKCYDARVRGGFPTLAKNSIKRTNEAETLTNKLKNLQEGDIIVVHGMVGCGKSFLVNQVLNDENLVKNYFDYKLFWVNLGEHKNLDNILITLWRLYSAVIPVVNQPPISHCPEQRETLRALLRDLFLNYKMSKALLVLDDAGNEEVISVFDFGCKTLVTTKNKEIVPSDHGIFVEVKAAFTEEESWEMFKPLGSKEAIGKNAEDVYQLSKGYPLVISTISSFLKESYEDAVNPRIWEYIKENLRGGRCPFDVGKGSVDDAIKICVDNLKDDLRQYYYSLSIFPQDVNIVPEVLMILWDKDNVYDVRHIMKKLADRSLVVSFYHNDKQSYLYGVHDVFLNYLKRVTSNERVEYHKKLIEGYNRVTNNNYIHLPNDNYTLQYIGYHLKESREFDKFKIYLNLPFIEAKIRAAGHADVLRDMYTYEKYIIQGSRNKIKLEDYRKFITRFGPEIFYNDKTDIIQYALQERETSSVFADALEIAQSNPQTPYFKMRFPKESRNYSDKFKSKQDITAACYVNSKQILVATADGKIELFDNERSLYSLNDHKLAVTSLKLDNTKKYLLSISEDRSVRLWELRTNSRRSWDLSTCGSNVDPRDRQRDWKNIIINEPTVNSKLFKLNSSDDYYVTAAFCPNFSISKRIVLGTNSGVVSLWDTNNMTQIYTSGPPRGYAISNLLCVHVSSITEPCVIYNCNSSIFLWELKPKKMEYIMQLHNMNEPNSVFLSYMNNIPEIVSVSEKNITVWQFDNLKTSKKLYDLNMSCMGATLTNDSQYLILSTSENSLYIWDKKQHKNIDVLYYWGLTKSLDTYYDEESSVHVLLISSDKKSLKQCEINPQEQDKSITDFPVFSSCWKKNTPLTAVRGKSKKIEIYHHYQLFVETEEISDNITFIKFCDMDNVIYGLENGEVREFEFKSKTDKLLMKVEGSIISIELYSCENIRSSMLVVVTKDNAENNVTILFNKKVISKFFPMPKLMFRLDDLLYIVDKTGNISSWDVLNDLVSTCYKYSSQVSTATICPFKKHMAVIVEHYDSYIAKIFETAPDINLVKEFKIYGVPTCSCYSFDGGILAIGMKSGEIQICNMVGAFKTTTLRLHETPVEYMLFSPGLEPILVSLGDQIAWWNLKKFHKGNSSGIKNQHLEGGCTMDSLYWSSKMKTRSEHYLIACLKLHEQYAKIISASPNFKSFLTVDGTGRIYLMEVV